MFWRRRFSLGKNALLALLSLSRVLDDFICQPLIEGCEFGCQDDCLEHPEPDLFMKAGGAQGAVIPNTCHHGHWM